MLVVCNLSPMGIQQEYKNQTMRKGFIVQKDSGSGYMYTSGKVLNISAKIFECLTIVNGTYLKCIVDIQAIHLET